MQRLVFTVAIGCASRTLMLRDRLLRVPKKMTEADAGTTLTRHRIPSGDNLLDAALVEPTGRPVRAAVLICHGIGETVEHWRAAQGLLAEHGVASLVFNYSGYGRSTGRIDAKQCERDAVAAFRFLRQRLPSHPVSLLGFSLGSGIATAVVTEVVAHHLVLCAAFTSLRHAAGRLGVPSVATRLLPNLWNTQAALETCSTPVVIVHGERDRLFPVTMAQELARACGGPCELVVVPKLSHNAPIYQPQVAYWALIADRLSDFSR